MGRTGERTVEVALSQYTGTFAFFTANPQAHAGYPEHYPEHEAIVLDRLGLRG